MSRINFVIFGVFALLSQEVFAHGFGYSEPNQRRWARHFGHCAGKTQSPIAVSASKATPVLMPAVDMIGYHNLLPSPLDIVNNGHTVSITLPKLGAQQLEMGEFVPYIQGAKLPGQFEIEGIHFHWGDKNNRGAEHVVNDIRYCMEMHLVHRNKKYASLDEALDYPDGAAVLAFFFNLEENEVNGLHVLTRHLNLIDAPKKDASLNVTFSLSALLQGVDTDRFFTYKGSLTTPPCSEAVTWVIYPDPIPVSTKQISRFRQLHDTQDGALVDNYRQLQPLGNRRVFMRVDNVYHTNLNTLHSAVSSANIDWFY